MSSHLKVGDAKPAFDPKSEFRLYSMLFCPYAERVRLVLAAKEITDYDTVNVQLRENIPEWFGEVNPLQKVPALEFPNGDTLYESLLVSDYIDELYPKNRLHPSDPMEKAQQRLYVETFASAFIPIVYKCIGERTDENKQVLVERLSDIEKHLAKKNFFGGSHQPAMVDYMIWPFFERLPTIHQLSSKLHPNLVTWCKKMHEVPAVKNTAISVEKYNLYYRGYREGKLNYDL